MLFYSLNNKLRCMRNFIQIYLFILFLLMAGAVNAQKVVSTAKVNNKKNILLRPNSRDYAPKYLDNTFNLVETSKDGNLFFRRRPLRPILNMPNNSGLKNNPNLQRRQINMIRRPI